MSLRIFEKRSFEQTKSVSSVLPTLINSRPSFIENENEHVDKEEHNVNNITSRSDYEKIHDLSNIDHSECIDDGDNDECGDDTRNQEFKPLLMIDQIHDNDFPSLSPFRFPVIRATATCPDTTKSSCTSIGTSTTTLEEGLQINYSESLRQRRYCHNVDDIFRPVIESNKSSNKKTDCKRILDRDAAFFQSRGNWKVKHKSRNAIGFSNAIDINDDGKRLTCSKMFWDSWFYRLVYQRTIILLLIILAIYAMIICLYAMIYYNLSHYGRMSKIHAHNASTNNFTLSSTDGTAVLNDYYCGMDITTHIEAFYFSLSTMATIGYGVSNYFFGDCYAPLFLIFSQVCCSIVFNAIAASVLFLRISRGHKRMKTILFSNHATIQYINHVPHLMFRIAELRRYQLFDASIRCYCIKSERYPITASTGTIYDDNSNHDSQGMQSPLLPATATDLDRNKLQTTFYVTKSMKLLHEETCPQILMSLPQVIVHRMDDSSPLLPSIGRNDTSNYWYDEHGCPHRSEACHYNRKMTYRCNDDSVDESALDLHDDQTEATKMFFEDRNIEIVILLEGTDELTGAVIQARHSYTYNDILWNHTFAPCVFPCERDLPSTSLLIDDCQEPHEMRETPPNWCQKNRSRSGNRKMLVETRTAPVCEIDFSRFNNMIAVSNNTEYSPYVDY